MEQSRTTGRQLGYFDVAPQQLKKTGFRVGSGTKLKLLLRSVLRSAGSLFNTSGHGDLANHEETLLRTLQDGLPEGMPS